MVSIKDNKYKIKNMDINKLISSGFRKYKIKDENEYDILVHRFPVLKDGRYTTLECEIIISTDTFKVKFDVYLAGTKKMYNLFYYHEYGDYPILKVINNNILKEFKKYSIVRDNK